MSYQDEIYNLLNDFSVEHFHDSTEAIVSVADFDSLMRKIGDVLSRENC
jgi:hypothetical protein